jgi:hypothetical protein
MEDQYADMTSAIVGDVIIAVEALTDTAGHPPALGDRELEDAIDPLCHRDLAGGRWRRHDARQVAGALGTQPSTRVVGAALLYKEACEDVDVMLIEVDDDEGETAPDASESDREEVLTEQLDDLRRFLDSIPAHAIADSMILWELQAAGMARHPARLTALCDQLVARSPTPENLAICARASFLSIAAPSASTSVPTAWVPAWCSDASWLQALDWLLSFGAAALCGRALDSLLSRRNAPEEHSAHRETAVRVAHWIQRFGVFDRPTGSQRLMLAWAGFLLHRQGFQADCLEAGDVFMSEGLSLKVPQTFREECLRAAAACFVASGKAERAEEPLRRLAESVTDRTGVMFQIAQCCHLAGKDVETFAAMEDFARLYHGTEQEEFLTSLVLKYGLLAKERDTAKDVIVQMAMASPTRAQGEAIVRWLDPRYGQLGDVARKRWWAGIFVLSSRENSNMLEGEVWRLAAENFCEAANMELKRLAISPFCRANASAIHDLLADPMSRKEWEKVTKGKGSLGQNVAFLEDRQRHSASTACQKWLSERQPRLKLHLKNKAISVKRLNDLRNQAAHETVTEEQAREAYQLATEFIATLDR